MNILSIVDIPESKFKMDYEHRILTMGSCFAENIGNKFENAFFNICINPFGVLFNPSSISQNLRRLVYNKTFNESELFQSGSLWNSFDHSSLYSDTSVEKTLANIQKTFQTAQNFLKSADWLIITFGTSRIFELKGNNQLVANCHKLPADKFNVRNLSVDEIVEDYQLLISELQKFNPNLKIIFTVSPVRHLKDGAHQNQMNKSILLLAIDKLVNQYSNCQYIPAYEIVLDELRDYRFYESDLVHPSQLAIDIIWQKMEECFFDDKGKSAKKELENYRSRLNHRFIHPDSDESLKFRSQTEIIGNQLQQKYPYLNISK